MAIIVDATYENGVFKLAEPVPLPEGALVRLTVTPVDDDYDPLDDVIGICKDGPDVSLAQRHDDFLYGTLPSKEPKKP